MFKFISFMITSILSNYIISGNDCTSNKLIHCTHWSTVIAYVAVLNSRKTISIYFFFELGRPREIFMVLLLS